MGRLTGFGGARPSKGMSWLAAAVGLGMVISVILFFVSMKIGLAFFSVSGWRPSSGSSATTSRTR